MKRILPIFNNPPLIGVDDYTHILSIVLTHPKAYAWMAENYVQLIGDGNLDNDIMLYNFINHNILYNTEYYFVANNKSCPFLDIYRDSYLECHNKNISIVDYLKSKINNDFYIFLFLDTSKILAYNNSVPERHCPLIFGFDDDDEIFYFRDYCSLHYKTHTAKYKEIEQAVNSFLTSQAIRETVDYDIIYQYGINRIRLIDIDYMFNVDRLKLLLQDYLDGNQMKNIYSKFINNKGYSYGISVYDVTITALEKYLEQDSDNIGRLVRYVQYIDHKVAMQIRIDFLKSNNFIKQSDFERLYSAFEEAKKIAHIMRNFYMKYSITKNKKNIYKMIDTLKQLKDIDIKYIKELLEILSR